MRYLQPNGYQPAVAGAVASALSLIGGAASGFDIALVQRLLQHSSASTTQRYIGIEPEKIETAIQNHAQLL